MGEDTTTTGLAESKPKRTSVTVNKASNGFIVSFGYGDEPAKVFYEISGVLEEIREYLA
ncbi:MAG: hypothetical protein AB1545_15635 [Thermodesulfobacteriota bacterium]